jgi:hypothetical protein
LPISDGKVELPIACARESTGADLIMQWLANALAVWTAEPDARRLREALLNVLVLLESSVDSSVGSAIEGGRRSR